VRNLLQPARADAVRALLVLLYLLESHAKSIPELLLAHRKHHSTHAHAIAHMRINWIWRLLGHHGSSLDYRSTKAYGLNKLSRNECSETVGCFWQH
jgi:hypothetical protein